MGVSQAPETSGGLEVKPLIKIYHEVNGERRVYDKEEYEKFKAVREGSSSNIVLEGKENEFGRFRVNVYATLEDDNIVVYVEKVWIPNFGYGWEEVVVRKITLPYW